MKQQIIKPLLEGLFGDQKLWQNFQSLQKERREENKEKITAFIKVGLKNDWLNRSIDIDDGDFVCEDFLEFNSFMILESKDQLKAELDYSNWAINQGFIYQDFAFINQVNGGKEWAVFKYNKETNKAFQFESWTGFAVKDEDFSRILKASDEQLKSLEW